MAAGAGALLTLNAGSSSIKYALFDDALQPLRRGQVDGLGMQPGERTHEQALRQVLDGMGRLSLKAVGHRVVHGGTR
ncbi:MAG TPA: acetate kinase, partial [Rubrivivax sp.]|nr:acetate kinase [Rubrivivax sp.]